VKRTDVLQRGPYFCKVGPRVNVEVRVDLIALDIFSK